MQLEGAAAKVVRPRRPRRRNLKRPHGPRVHVAVDRRVPRLRLYPMLATLYFSFTRYDLLSDPEWYGLQNYVYMFTKDPNFWVAVRNTLWIIVFGVPLQIGCRSSQPGCSRSRRRA